MSISTSNHRGFILPGATINDTRLGDLVAVKSALIAIDSDLENSQVAAVQKSSMGIPNGVASLDSNGKVLSTQLPSYVDDVLEFANLAAFPTIGETGKIYVAINNNIDSESYRWSGSIYVFITSGSVTSVAGKDGLVLLDKNDVGLSNVDNTSDSAKPMSTAQSIALVNAIATCTPINHIGLGGEAHSLANESSSGFMSVSDKIKLDNLTILGFTPINSNQLGINGGVATLGSDGKLSASQVPASSGSGSSFNGIMGTFPGAVNPIVGTPRFYPVSDVSIGNLFAWGSAVVVGDLVCGIRKNGTLIQTITIPNGQSKASLVLVTPITLTTNDYVTLDIVSGTGSDISIRLAL